ncbi:MAG: LPS export ABC transporter periplasmic protein LptC [Hyphomonadaceae bacterium]
MISTSHSTLETWSPGRAISLRQARIHSGLVHILRLVFTSAAVISAGLLLGPMVQNALSRPTPRPAPAVNVTILSPRFEGRDDNDNPYLLTAATARRRRDAPEVVDLVSPHLEDEISSQVEAREGVFDRKNQILDLYGDVVMTDAAGYRFTADKAKVYVHEGRVVGETPLKGTGPTGEVTADSYEVTGNGEHIYLSGNVWSRIRNTRDERPNR